MSKAQAPNNHNNFSGANIIVGFLRLFLKIDSRENLIASLKTQKINIKEILAASKKHKCHAILLHILTIYKLTEVYPGLAKRLSQIVQIKMIHNKGLREEFFKFSNQMDHHEIDYVVYKGLAFAQYFYPSQSLRHSVDIDIGMSLEDIPKASKILFKLGYEDYKNKIDYNNINKSRAYHIDFSYVKRNHNGNIQYNIELHWQAAHEVLQVPYSFKENNHKRVALNIGGNEVYTLPKVELAILILLHHGLVDAWGKLRHLIDLHFILKTLDHSELQLLRSRLKELKLNRCLDYGLNQLKILKRETNPDKLWELILSGNLSKNWSEYPTKFWWHLKMRESNLERIRVLISLVKFKLKFTGNGRDIG